VKQLSVALVGGGFMGKAHSLAYSLAPIAGDVGAQVSKRVLVDADATTARTLASQLGWESSSGDWREVVERDDIDIVDICTPPQFHREIALAALAAGKHVFCEKPLANTVAEAVEMRDAAQRAGVVAQIGFNYRHSPAIEFARLLLDRGQLGTPLQFRASYLQEGGFNANPNLWRAKRSTGGSGFVGDVGSHIIDTAEYLFGDIARVCGLARTSSEDGWMPESERLATDALDEAGVWIAEFANGALGSFAVNRLSSGHKNQILFGFDASKAAVEFDWNQRDEFRVSYVDGPADHMGFQTIHMNTEHPNGWWRLAGIGSGYAEVSAIQFQKFLRAIVSGVRAEPDFDQGLHVQQVVEAVLDSAAVGGWVDVPSRLPVPAGAR